MTSATRLEGRVGIAVRASSIFAAEAPDAWLLSATIGLRFLQLLRLSRLRSGSVRLLCPSSVVDAYAVSVWWCPRF